MPSPDSPWPGPRNLRTRRSRWHELLARPLTLVCIALAVLPDIDLLYPPMHRTATHSVGAVVLVTIIAAGVTGWVTGRINWRIALVCAAAYASHILTDWLGTDRNYAPYGIQMFWPFGKRVVHLGVGCVFAGGAAESVLRADDSNGRFGRDS